MAWLTIAAVLAAAGLLVVAVCAARLVVALRRLSREVARTRAVLEPRRALLERELAQTGRPSR